MSVYDWSEIARDWLVLVWVIVAGGCIGSFLNVVIYRLPDGRSLSVPGSHCPVCKNPLAWYDNVPVFAWLWLGAKCRHCRTSISIQYPLVEALTALMFCAAWFIAFNTSLVPGFADAGYENAWPAMTVRLMLIAMLIAATIIDARLFIIPLELPWFVTAAAFVGLPLGVWFRPLGVGHDMVPMVGSTTVNLALGASVGLVIAVVLLVVGAIPRSFDDEEEILAALAEEKKVAQQAAREAAAAEAAASSEAAPRNPTPELAQVMTEQVAVTPADEQQPDTTCEVADAGTSGHADESQDAAVAQDASPSADVAVAGATEEQDPNPTAPTPPPAAAENPSPVDEPEASPDNATVPQQTATEAVEEAIMAYPHPRREMFKELLFLAIPVVCAMVAMKILAGQVPDTGYAEVWRVLGGSVFGYFIGAGMIWGIRIGGTLGFGKEAMGLGDVHLLGAVGAVLGWKAAFVIFFMAPFFGLTYALVALGLGQILRKRLAPIPYGPHLATATVVVMFFYQPIIERVAPMFEVFEFFATR